MMRHHAQAFSRLQSQFPEAEVYVATSDKTEPDTSPFDFAEKQQIAQLGFGLRADKVLQVRNPYDPLNYPFDTESTVMIFVVGAKDMQPGSERFKFDNLDPETGLNMQVRDSTRPTHIQPISTMGRDPLPAKYRAYIYVTEDIPDEEGEAAKASDFRKQLRAAPDIQTAKKVFVKYYGEYNQQLFDLLYSKIVEPDMEKSNTEIQKIRKLAGLPEPELAEAAPVEYNEITDNERMLGSLGRALMAQAKKESDDELSNVMASVGQKFTVYGAPEQPGTLKDLAIALGLTENTILRFAEFAQKLYDKHGDLDSTDDADPDLADDDQELFQESGDEYITKRVIGHHDNEARMMQRDMLKIRDYADELIQQLDSMQDGDFPHWWQAKVVKAANYMSAVKHFLDGEMRLGPRDRIGHDQVDMGPVADEFMDDPEMDSGLL